MSSTEEIPPEKVKKERTEAQKAVLERARLKGIEVRKQLAKERREAKELAKFLRSALTGRLAFREIPTPGTSRIFPPTRTRTRLHRPPPPSSRTPCWSGTSARRLLGAR